MPSGQHALVADKEWQFSLKISTETEQNVAARNRTSMVVVAP